MIIEPAQADTLVIVLWAAVVLFSFVLGTARTTKIMIAVPAAAFVANSFGNFFQRIFLSSDNFVQGLQLVNLTGGNDTLILFKVITFALVAVLITTKGAFDVSMNKPTRATLSMGVNTLFGFLTGGVIVTILVIFLAGLSFTSGYPASADAQTLYTDSPLVKIMIDYQDFWFSAPFMALIFWSFFATGIIDDELI